MHASPLGFWGDNIRCMLRIVFGPPQTMPADRPSAPLRPDPSPSEPAKPATLRQVAAAVFWSFFGIRRGKDMAQDTTTIKLHHVIIVGLISGLVFVLALVALVTFITRGT